MGDATEALKRSQAEKAQLLQPIRLAPRRARPPLRQESRLLPSSSARRPLATVTSTAPSHRAPQKPAVDKRSSFFVETSPRVQIPMARNGFWQPRAVALENPGSIAEAYRHLASRIMRDLDAQGGHTLLVTSAVAGEGKTTTAVNLALALASASAKRRVALVDLNLRKPEIAKCMGVSATAGLQHVLGGKGELASIRARTSHPALDLYLSGPSQSGVHELIYGSHLRIVLDELSRHYAHVIIDSPPAVPFPDAALILESVDGCLAVVRAGETRLAAFEAMLEILPVAKVIGTFANHSRSAHHTTNPYR